jgi:hypothetical protein
MGEHLRRRVIASILVGLLSAGCAGGAPERRAPSYPTLTRAVVTTEDVERSIEDERALSVSSARLPGPGEAWFTVRAPTGSRPSAVEAFQSRPPERW